MISPISHQSTCRVHRPKARFRQRSACHKTAASPLAITDNHPVSGKCSHLCFQFLQWHRYRPLQMPFFIAFPVPDVDQIHGHVPLNPPFHLTHTYSLTHTAIPCPSCLTIPYVKSPLPVHHRKRARHTISNCCSGCCSHSCCLSCSDSYSGSYSGSCSDCGSGSCCHICFWNFWSHPYRYCNSLP